MDAEPFRSPAVVDESEPPPAGPRDGRRSRHAERMRKEQQRNAQRAHARMLIAASIYLLPTGILLWLAVRYVGSEPAVAALIAALAALLGCGPLAIIARRRWGVMPMYVLAVLSFLAIPFGTVAALLVFSSAGGARSLYR